MSFVATITGSNRSHGMVCMSFAESDAHSAANVSSLEKLSFNLSCSPNSRAFNCTLRWIIYKIVEANKGITYVQLKKILRGEFGIDRRLLDTTISSLTSPLLLNCLNKWRNPRTVSVGADVGIHLSVRENLSETFTLWRDRVLAEFPELADFNPPVLPSNRDRRQAG